MAAKKPMPKGGGKSSSAPFEPMSPGSFQMPAKRKALGHGGGSKTSKKAVSSSGKGKCG